MPNTIRLLPFEYQLLKWLCFSVFIGRAWQGIFWDLPLRAFLWSQSIMGPWVEWWTGDSWQAYATNVDQVDASINQLNFGLGVYWLICAITCLLMPFKKKWLNWILYLGSFTLMLLAALFWLEKFRAFGQFFEYSLQVGSPLLLVYFTYNKDISQKALNGVIILTMIAFCCHALYAIGFYPQPGPWIQWTMQMFFLPSDQAASMFLKVMGVLDIVAAFLILAPFKFLRNLALWYCIIWGFMTAFARVSSNFYWDFPWSSLHQWTYETVLRLVHGGIPLLLWLWFRRLDQLKNK